MKYGSLHTSHDARDFMKEGRLSYSSFFNVIVGTAVLSISSVAYSSSTCNKIYHHIYWRPMKFTDNHITLVKA